MNLLIITAPQATGKMTVGQEIAKLTGMKLCHNHMIVDLVLALFDGGFDNPDLFSTMRNIDDTIMQGIAQSTDHPGLITTICLDFNDKEDIEHNLTKPKELFEGYGHNVYFLELEADFDERIKRNVSENRLAHKPSKRDITHSESLLHCWEKYRMNSQDDFPYPDQHLKINNTSISAEEVAKRVVEYFNL